MFLRKGSTTKTTLDILLFVDILLFILHYIRHKMRVKKVHKCQRQERKYIKNI